MPKIATLTFGQAEYEDTFNNITEGASPLSTSHPNGTWGEIGGRKFFLNGMDRREGTDAMISPMFFRRVPSMCSTFGRAGIENNVETILRFMKQKGAWVEFTLNDIPSLTKADIKYLYYSGWLNRHKETYVITMGLIKFMLTKLA
jgi:hypothetical protein